MGKTRYDKCTEVLKPYKGTNINTDKLRRIVMAHIGGTEGVVFGTIAFMREVGLIVDMGNCRWEIK